MGITLEVIVIRAQGGVTRVNLACKQAGAADASSACLIDAWAASAAGRR
jgi:hypothetical protein